MNQRIIEKYEILQEIGRGGYGTVYLARHKQLGVLKAIKELRTKTRLEKARVNREVDILKQAQHPHVIAIDDVMQSEHVTYICMEYAEGGSLEKKLEGGIKREECLGITLDILKGVQALHARGIIHRDLKPGNILFDTTGKAKIGDFGIAKANTNISRLTKTGKVLGTIGYMAPEQLLGKKDEVDEQSDVYAVGILLYEMLAGKHPLKGANQIETVNRALSERYVVPLKANTRDNDLKNICYRAIKKNKAKRYVSAGEMLEELYGYYLKNVHGKKGGFSIFYSKGVQNVLLGTLAGVMMTGMSVNMFFSENSAETRWSKKDEEYQKLLMNDNVKEGEILRLIQKEVQRTIYGKLQEKSEVDITETTLRGKELYGLGVIYYEGRGVGKNYEVAYKYFEQASKYGVIDAYMKLGDMNLKGKGISENKQKAIEYYEYVAEKGDPRGYYNLGIIYGKQDKEEEFLYNLKKSASMNHHQAISDLVRFYEVAHNEKEFLYYLQKGVEIGNTSCLRNMGINFLLGEYGIKQDEKKGIDYIKKSIIYGDIDSVRFLLNYEKLDESVKDKLFQDIFQFVSKKRDKGDKYLTTLAFMYQKGFGVEKNYKRAKECYERAIMLGDAIAMNNLGNMYLDGDGVQQNYAKAKKLFESAIELERASGLNSLAFMYSEGLGVQQDYAKAKELYERAAELGDASAICNLGVVYYKGQGVKINYVKSIELFEEAVALGSAVAMYELGSMYFKGLGVVKNYNKAKELFESAAESKNVGAMNNLACMYISGDGVKKDYSKAKLLLEDALRLGNDSAAYNLGRMYFEGEGVQKNYIKAVELYEKAVVMGNSDAMGELGCLYLYGLGGVTKNESRAKELFEGAIKLGHTYAMVHLGQMYEQNGRQEDYIEAKNLYERAAKLKNPIAINNLAFMYEKGRGVIQNFYKAKELYEDAIKLGSSSALNNLGNMYYNGYGVQKNLYEAKILYENAARLGETNAMNTLGLMYYNGYGVKQDKQKAFSLFQKSALLGNQSGIQYLNTLK